MSTPNDTMNATSPQTSNAPRLDAGATCEMCAQPGSVLKYIDQPQRLSAHMARRTWQLGGASMAIEADADGRVVGSHIRSAGRMLGIALHVDGKVVRREPPSLKAWETITCSCATLYGARDHVP